MNAVFPDTHFPTTWGMINRYPPTWHPDLRLHHIPHSNHKYVHIWHQVTSRHLFPVIPQANTNNLTFQPRALFINTGFFDYNKQLQFYRISKIFFRNTKVVMKSRLTRASSFISLTCNTIKMNLRIPHEARIKCIPNLNHLDIPKQNLRSV